MTSDSSQSQSNKTLYGIAIISFMVLSAWVVRLEQRLAIMEGHMTDKGIHMPLADKVGTFVLRTEFNAQVTRRDQEFDKIHRGLESLGQKIDRLNERHTSD